MLTELKIGDFLHRKKVPVKILPDEEYSLVTVKLYHKGVILREKKKGSLLGSNMYRVSAGDFILSGIDARNGAFGIVPEELEGAIVTNDFWYFDVDESKVKRDFFYWLTTTPLFLDACQKSSKGETQRIRLQKDLFNGFVFHFPPIEEQDSFLQSFGCIDKSLSSLKMESSKQSAYLTKLRKAILQEAIEGKLTADWRKENPVRKGDPDFDAEALLEKIQAEKEKLIKEGKIKKQKPLAPIKLEEVPFDLPEGWVWTRLGEICSKIHYGFNASAKFNKRDVRLLRITDIQDNTVDWDNVPGCDFSNSDLDNYMLSKNDILIARTGGTIGKTFLVREVPVKSLFASYLIRAIPSVRISAQFLKLFVECPYYWQQLYAASWGAAQPNVNGTSLSNLKLPLPPLAEQQAIVDRVEKLLSMVDELEKQVSERKEQSEQLMQAVLREAFEGES